jgi:serine/threonine protein kinase
LPTAPPASLHPAHLPPGTQVGPWRVVARAGCGVHGAVYRAVSARSQFAPPVALKLALRPGDPRFAREVELLSRIRHPSVPRLWDSGTWQSPEGTRYPWLAMEWIDGVPLYDWPWQHSASSAQCARVLAQLARALQALHALGAVHRDIKGANVLVGASDGRAMLTDFGLGSFPGVELLTPPAVCVGTPLYRSPEASLFEIHSSRDRSARYVHQPADDLYALGVTACRMLTGEYPEWGEPEQDEHGTWHLHTVRTPASLLRVEPSLRALILRMLAVRPEQRGTAEELAEGLEVAASAAVEPRIAEAASHKKSHLKRGRSPRHELPRWPWLTVAACLALIVWACWAASGKSGENTSIAQARTEDSGQQDAGTAGLGEAASTASRVGGPEEPSVQELLAEEPLPEPQPGQMRPNAKGRCPHKRQVVLNRACWVPMDPEECEALGSNGNGQLFKGRCYVPALSPDRPSTSQPTGPP